MNRTAYKGFGVCLCMCLGCVPLSMGPIYTEDVLVFEAGLIGSWQELDREPGQQWRILRGAGKSYEIQVTDQEGVVEVSYAGHLVQLRGVYFMDFLVTGGSAYPEDPIALQLLPVHLFMKLALVDGNLRLYSLDVDWLMARADQGRLFVPHHRVEALDDWPVFSASPRRMQQFLKRWAHKEAAWDEAMVLTPVTTRDTVVSPES